MLLDCAEPFFLMLLAMFSDLFAYNHTIQCYKAYYVLGPHSKKVIQELI